MNILGISAFYHDSACCLLRDGRLIAAAAEERFSRVKNDPRLPVSAFRFCLEQGGLGIDQLDRVAYYESPIGKLGRQLWAGARGGSAEVLEWLDPEAATRTIRERLGWDGPLVTHDHHLSHAASAFYFSPFEDAAVLTVDGVGEWATTTYGRGDGARLELFERVEFPHSLGLFYSTLTAFLGFAVNRGEYKVMGLAAYGEPRFVTPLRRLFAEAPAGRYALDPTYFDYVRGDRMYTDALIELLDHPPRSPGSELEAFHFDLAASVQQVLEEALLREVRWLHGKVGGSNLVMAGGVALNGVANARILAEGPFERLFVQPAAGDAGGCMGAAALSAVELGQGRPLPLEHLYLGPRWADGEIARILAGSDVGARCFRDREDELLDAVVDGLEEGLVVGWFSGAMEMGPRALGARSILADPRRPEIQERVNARIKRREGFRPFAPSVLAEKADEVFVLDHDAPYMVETCAVREPEKLPAVAHIDGSARPQTVGSHHPRYRALLEAWHRRTGCPLLLNTSFNLRGEPIVASPTDALSCFARSGLDALVLENHLILRSDLPSHWAEHLEAWSGPRSSRFATERPGAAGRLYTFV